MVFCLKNAPDIDALDCDELISFVNRNFIAELPHFQGNEYNNIGWWGNENKLSEDFKAKVIRSSTMSLTTLILCQIVLKYMI
jgi:hypothetical protein